MLKNYKRIPYDPTRDEINASIEIFRIKVRPANTLIPKKILTYILWLHEITVFEEWLSVLSNRLIPNKSLILKTYFILRFPISRTTWWGWCSFTTYMSLHDMIYQLSLRQNLGSQLIVILRTVNVIYHSYQFWVWLIYLIHTLFYVDETLICWHHFLPSMKTHVRLTLFNRIRFIISQRIYVAKFSMYWNNS